MKPKCDCLNFCGDDPHIDKGLVRPCPTFQQETARKRLYAAAPDMLEFAKAVVRYAGSAGDDYLADKARDVIARATGDNQ